MTKALMVYSNDLVGGHASGNEVNLFGASSATATEANTQYSATQAATFSLLRRNIISGGSGTNTCTFRESGADSALTVAAAGTGVAEDATNSVLVEAANLFNLALTDTASTPVYAYVMANVSFSSGHGCFHASSAFGGRVHDVASATQFIGINGGLPVDGQATEDNVAFKVRAYDTWVAFQVRVTANARTNNSVFKNRINKGDGTASITFAGAETGLKIVTGLTDAITDGQVVNASITLLTGVEDLTVAFVGATFTSSTVKSEVCLASHGGVARAASATANYRAVGGNLDDWATAITDAQARVKVGFTATASNLRCYLSANTYTVNGTLKLFVNGSAALTTTITLLGGAAWYENTADTVALAATDEISFEFDEGATGSITVHMVAVTLEDTTVAGATVFRFLTLLGAGS